MRKLNATAIGSASLLIWATSAALITSLEQIPVFEVLTIVLSTCFIATVIKLTLQKRWHTTRQPWLIWLVGTCGIIGNDVAYMTAFRFAPALQIDLISYLWPIMLALMVGCLPNETFSRRYLLGALFGIAATYMAINPTLTHLHYEHQYMIGYLIAASGAAIWCAYVLIAQLFRDAPIEMMGLYCGIGALLTLVTHIGLHEATLIPTATDATQLIFVGLGPAMLAYFCWDHGIKHGNFKLLSMLSFCTPLLSAALLILTGKGTLTMRLGIAYLLIGLGIAISRQPTTRESDT